MLNVKSNMANMVNAEIKDDVAELRAEFRARGFYERPLRPMLAQWSIHLAIGFGGLAAFIAIPSPAARIVTMLVSCFGFIGLATLGHTASHNAASEDRPWNRFLYYFTYPFLLQLSACFWHDTHVQKHHPAPNLIGIDPDCDLRPMFALNDHHQSGVGLGRRIYWKVQWLLFPFALCLNALNIQRKGWQFLVRAVRNPETRTADVWLDLACVTLHLVLWIGVPMFFFPVASVLGLYALRTAIIGIALFCILAPGHFPAEAKCLEGHQRDAGGFYLRQTVATVNFDTGPIGRLLCSGLEFQIEHHLFPSISHIHYPRMAPIVRDFCRRNGLPYNQLGWGEAIWKSYRVLIAPKPVFSSVEELRLEPIVETAESA